MRIGSSQQNKVFTKLNLEGSLEFIANYFISSGISVCLISVGWEPILLKILGERLTHEPPQKERKLCYQYTSIGHPSQ